VSKHLSILTHLCLYTLRLATRRRRRHLHSPVRAAGLPRRLSCQCLASSGSLLLLHLLLHSERSISAESKILHVE
jgi:hypothetical protein